MTLGLRGRTGRLSALPLLSVAMGLGGPSCADTRLLGSQCEAEPCQTPAAVPSSTCLLGEWERRDVYDEAFEELCIPPLDSGDGTVDCEMHWLLSQEQCRQEFLHPGEYGQQSRFVRIDDGRTVQTTSDGASCVVDQVPSLAGAPAARFLDGTPAGEGFYYVERDSVPLGCAGQSAIRLTPGARPPPGTVMVVVCREALDNAGRALDDQERAAACRLGSADSAAGQACVPLIEPPAMSDGGTRSRTGGFLPVARYVELGSAQCASGLCLFQVSACEADATNCAPPELGDARAYCTCACDGFSSCCPAGFECVSPTFIRGEDRVGLCMREGVAP